MSLALHVLSIDLPSVSSLSENLSSKRPRTEQTERHLQQPRTPLQRLTCGAWQLQQLGFSSGSDDLRTHLVKRNWSILRSTKCTLLRRGIAVDARSSRSNRDERVFNSAAVFGQLDRSMSAAAEADGQMPRTVDDVQYHHNGMIAGALAEQRVFIIGAQQRATMKKPVVRHVKELSRPCCLMRWRPGANRAEILAVPKVAGAPVSLYSIASSTSHAVARMQTAAEWGRCRDAVFINTNITVSAFTDGKLRIWDTRTPLKPSISIDWFVDNKL